MHYLKIIKTFFYQLLMVSILLFINPASTVSALAENVDGIASSAKPFVIYDEMRFRNKPPSLDLGLTPIDVVYMAELWPSKNINSQVNVPYLHTFFSKNRFSGQALVCLDVETWPMDGRQHTEAEVKQSVSKYLAILESFRKVRPETPVGYYGVPPIRDYFSPVNNRQDSVQAWHTANRRLDDLGDVVDVIFPSLYTFRNSPEDWVTYAIANITEASRYGKPVIAFIWPQYHGSNKLLDGRYIDAKFWRLQLETLYEHADGVVIWSPYTNAPQWRSDFPWWQATREFIDEKNISGSVGQAE